MALETAMRITEQVHESLAERSLAAGAVRSAASAADPAASAADHTATAINPAAGAKS